MDAEFDRQIRALCTAGYPQVAGQTPESFRARLEALRPLLSGLPAGPAPAAGDRFVVVPATARAVPEQAVRLLRLAGGTRAGQVDPNHGEEGLAPYQPLPQDGVPVAEDYLLVDVRRGDEFRDVPPREAVERIRDKGRSPLTIPEGIAWVLIHPEVLQPNHCFMLAGSRRGDRRVPALWISNRAPKLGWCWEGNPHSWLGTASAGCRLSAALRAAS